MIRLEVDELTDVAITEMRQPGEFGSSPIELQDGNMSPKLCTVAGEGACQQLCQLSMVSADVDEVMCAQENVSDAISEFGVRPDNFVIVQAKNDRIVFADQLGQMPDVPVPDRGEPQFVPDANAFFFSINKDPTRHHEADGQYLHDVDSLNPNAVMAAGMRLADCGSLLIRMANRKGNPIIGIEHLTRTNLRPPSHYEHQFNGQAVSWTEYVLRSAIEHYEANPGTVYLDLIGVIANEDFILSFSSEEKKNSNWPGWQDAGVMELVERGVEEDKYLVRYRDIVEQELRNAAANIGILEEHLNLSRAISTGDRSSGHASNHWSGKRHKLIAPGRDMHIVGHTTNTLRRRQLLRELEQLLDTIEGLSSTGHHADEEWSRIRRINKQLETIPES